MKMLGNFLRVAVRILVRDRMYTVLNVAGLAIGIAAASMLGLYVWHETHYDGFFSKADRIYRVDKTEFMPGREPVTYSSTPKPLAPLLPQDFPEIETSVRVHDEPVVVARDGSPFREHMQVVDPDFFRLFDLPFIAGDPATALAAPGTVVLTESLARKYFNGVDVLGRSLTLTNGISLTVSGVIRDLPTNTHLRRDAMLTNIRTRLGENVDGWFARMDTVWNSNFLQTYILVKPGTDPVALTARFPAFLSARDPNYLSTGTNKPSKALVLTGLTHIHTDPTGVPANLLGVLHGLEAVAAVVLGIAVVNFVNLSTSRSSLRVREVAVRKALGAPRSMLVGQFMVESVLLTLVAAVLAYVLLEVAMPASVAALGIRFDRAYLYSPWLLLAELLGVVAVGGVAGLYPALVLSRPTASVLLRGGPTAAGGAGVRALLVVAQFSAAILLAIATIVIFQQTRYVSSQQLGFNADGVLLLRELHQPEARAHIESFRQALLRIPGVAQAGAAFHAPSDGSDSTDNYHVPGTLDDGTIVFRSEYIGHDYLQAMGVRLLAGRLFDRAATADALRPPGSTVGEGGVTVRASDPPGRTAVLSWRAAQRLGFHTAEEAVGRQVIYDVDYPLTIIGVVDDVQFNSARVALQPTAFLLDESGLDVMAVRLTPAADAATLAAIDRLWRDSFPTIPVNREFLDDHVRDAYAAELRQGTLLAGFTGLAILIACLGLFGLAAFTAQRRTKEIGLRKVLGAGVPDIMRLLVWQFSKPVMVANLIAWPLAWLGLSHWLQGYAYRIALNPLVFALAGLAALLIAWVTVAGHAARVAAAKPVDALRYE
ncbi:ABC transporter permease [Nitrospirillum pindoramense]|uniref:Putative ABC transport system permease protein n=1 Tax=Nitrospirillum amazonense TaxID=28077 RepID=A0A560HH07_9PROT|nr:ABC transporter permease [Nitrospirillum amazonense]TWB45748.1 putative ABC transport system permease protein [Nitrospirillum amazonense]